VLHLFRAEVHGISNHGKRIAKVRSSANTSTWVNGRRRRAGEEFSFTAAGYHPERRG
jgi:hypothetical protein